jgi:hypothetical protein
MSDLLVMLASARGQLACYVCNKFAQVQLLDGQPDIWGDEMGFQAVVHKLMKAFAITISVLLVCPERRLEFRQILRFSRAGDKAHSACFWGLKTHF